MESEVAYEWTELRIVRSVVASARKVLKGKIRFEVSVEFCLGRAGIGGPDLVSWLQKTWVLGKVRLRAHVTVVTKPNTVQAYSTPHACRQVSADKI
jgi:hypothetical protein